MSSFRVYRGGPITGLTHVEVTAWRNEVGMKLLAKGIQPVDPMRDTPRPLGGGAYDDDPKWLNLNFDPYGRDRSDIEGSDVILFNFLGAERVSIGSLWELGYASAGGQYIVVVMRPGNYHDHYFVKKAAAVVVGSLDEAIDAIEERARECALMS